MSEEKIEGAAEASEGTKAEKANVLSGLLSKLPKKEDGDAAVEGKSPRNKKKLGIIAGVVAAVVLVAGIGFWTWHEQPSFCGAICHTPMDPYLATYEAEPVDGAIDKYGVEVDGTTMLAAVHRVQAGSTCLDCHEPSLIQQIGEGLSWATGSYEAIENDAYGVVIPERDLSDLTAATGKDYDQFCLNSGCHTDQSRESLAELFADREHNYHDQSNAPHGEVAECGDCHKAHTQSVVMCTECHNERDIEIPEGWTEA